MEQFKVSIEVNINFSESTKSFLSNLFNVQHKTVTTETKVAAVETKAKTETKVVAAETKAEKKVEKNTESSVTIEMVRKALSEKVNDNRAKIKEKLEELGAPSVTKLNPEKYEEMYNFLNSL